MRWTHRIYKTQTWIFFQHTPNTAVYTLSLHDALPIFGQDRDLFRPDRRDAGRRPPGAGAAARDRALGAVARPLPPAVRSEEHTSELQSRRHLVCWPLLEKKKRKPEHLHCGAPRHQPGP